MAATTNGKSNTADKPRKQSKRDNKVNKPDHIKRTTARKRHIFTMDCTQSTGGFGFTTVPSYDDPSILCLSIVAHIRAYT
ncbi:hypothetical protein JADG_001402 [Aureobasidium aubasidani]|nr:hypothetical protein JADG_001402 [Aureobasidium pullulans]